MDRDSTDATGGGLDRDSTAAADFIRLIVADNVKAPRSAGRISTRFPPEPNGYLHIGHAKSICLNFGIAAEFGGVCNLRFDDTNPEAEDHEFVEAILADVAWLGFTPANVFYASDYFGQIYDWAEVLVGKGLAYVDDQDGDTIRAQRGGFGKPGVESPYRNRDAAENLALLRGMRDGEFADGSRVL